MKLDTFLEVATCHLLYCKGSQREVAKKWFIEKGFQLNVAEGNRKYPFFEWLQANHGPKKITSFSHHGANTLSIDGKTFQFKELNLLEEVQAQTPNENLDKIQTRQDYAESLKKVIAFTTKVRSQYEGVFASALFALENSFQGIIEKLKAAKFLAEVVRFVEEEKIAVQDLMSLGLAEDKLSPLLSLGLADQFYGMGSWSDQQYESDTETEEYDAVSMSLIKNMKAYHHALLST